LDQFGFDWTARNICNGCHSKWNVTFNDYRYFNERNKCINSEIKKAESADEYLIQSSTKNYFCIPVGNNDASGIFERGTDLYRL